MGEINVCFSTVNCGPTIVAKAVVLNDILGSNPQVVISPTAVKLTSELTPADPQWFVPGPIDLLLGVDVLGLILSGDKRVLQPCGLMALQTIFGYTFFGPVLRGLVPRVENEVVTVGLSLSDAVQRFWEVEEPPKAPRVDPAEQECELSYQNNTGRLADGRFVTRLPFRAARPPLGQSHALAEKRLLSMERRMKRDSDLRAKYIEFMREYEALGHMSRPTIDWRSLEHYFLPHHAVLKTPGGKIRVVFDGSAPTSNGVSLNQCLHSGPKLHRDISDILTNFRRHQIVFVADIRMMFRQSVVHRDDRRYQMILWRERPCDPMRVYELNTTTYGLTSSPYIAIRTLLELAHRERLNYPRAAAILEDSVYVDDVCTGASTATEALILRDELIAILKSGGYELRKWLSNCPDLLRDLPVEHQQDPLLFEDADNPNLIAVLGIQYQPVQDVFTYRFKLDPPKTWTKRSVLSTVARTFDPNGWITPVIFLAKCFLQKLWIAEVTWDEPLQGDLLTEWCSIVYSLPDVNRISLPRLFLPFGKCKVSLHGFCDASERGYAAVVFLRTISLSGHVGLHLIMAKSKVAPIRTRLTIPKLELSGAALLTRLLNHVCDTLGRTVEISDVFAWTDSEIVLCWLRTSVHNLEVFVANRISQIQSSATPLIWRHVPGELNPADCASRGCEAPVLVNHSLWWGPGWLSHPAASWPQNRFSSPEALPGLRVGVMETQPVYDLNPLLERYSSLSKLIGVTARIRRFLLHARNPAQRALTMELALSPLERQEALLFWVRVVQVEHFEPIIDALKGGSRIKGSIARLNPFLDASGLLRVGGRLRNSNLPYGARHPLLLPKGGTLVSLLVSDRHVANAHAGCNALVAILQREFWILSARRTIRGIIFRCMPCYRLTATPTQPMMGDLPSDRVSESRPFACVGTDFAGPFLVKTSQLRNARSVKAYLCVFVCLASKAVHLELVSALSTEAFLATLGRFVSRRGLPSLIRSDNGTNYKGTDRYLNEICNYLNSDKDNLRFAMSRMGIKWQFDPPVCPHWGGIFEAVVKVTKTHLRRVIGETILTFEELATVFCKIEAVLNSRPLCPVSSDPNDLEALTPGHFLIGQPLTALPEYPFGEIKSSRLSRFELLQQMTQSFWHRWSLEYLHILQQRVKWTDKTDPPHVGDLVLVKESNLLPLYWRRGRIVNLWNGSDGVPRVAEVMVGDSVLKRAVASLARLPIY